MTEAAALYLGVDGGGTKTALVLIDSDGAIRATHLAPGAYYLTIGLDALGTLLAGAVGSVLAKAALLTAGTRPAFAALSQRLADGTVSLDQRWAGVLAGLLRSDD